VYVNNDPVNWVDPWGLSANDARPLTQAEINAHKAATLGTKPVNYDAIRVVEGRMPTPQEVLDAVAGAGVNMPQTKEEISKWLGRKDIEAVSLPNGTIYTKDKNPSEDLTAHEIEHQATYQNGATVTAGGVTTPLNTAAEVFNQLVHEANLYNQGAVNPYRTPGYLEYEANRVQERAQTILRGGTP
jgi:hypothetical protein